MHPLYQADSYCQVRCPNSPETDAHTYVYKGWTHTNTHRCFSAVSPLTQHLAPPAGHSGWLFYQTPPSITTDSYVRCVYIHVCVCVCTLLSLCEKSDIAIMGNQCRAKWKIAQYAGERHAWFLSLELHTWSSNTRGWRAENYNKTIIATCWKWKKLVHFSLL